MNGATGRLTVGATILLVLAAAMTQHVRAASVSDFKLDCESKAVFTWHGTVTDADGKPLEPGDYSLVYCYYEGSNLIGCCTATTSVGLKGAASATIALAQPIWEDTAKVPFSAMGETSAELWLEITVNGVLVSPRTSLTGVTLAVVGELQSTQQELKEKVQRIDALESKLLELQAFRSRVTAAIKALAEAVATGQKGSKGGGTD